MSLSLNISPKTPEQSRKEPLLSRRQWVIGLGGAGVAGTLATLYGPKLWRGVQDKIEQSRESVHDSYRRPGMSEDVIIESRGRCPYVKSPLLIYAEEERRLFPEHRLIDQAITIADNIANRVAQRCFKLYQEGVSQKSGPEAAQKLSMEDALRAVSAAEKNLKTYMQIFAKELNRAACFYSEESSLNRAVDPQVHAEKAFHLDCDLLCLFAAHAAKRHDVPLHIIIAPTHCYIGSPKFPEFAVEMTEFVIRKERTIGNETIIEEDIGSGYFSSHTAQKKKWRFDNAQDIETFEFFKALDDERVRTSAIGDLLGYMLARSSGINPIEALEKTCAVADQELAHMGGKDLIAQNVYAAHVKARTWYLEHWRETGESRYREAGIKHAKQIIALKAGENGKHLVAVYNTRDEDSLLEFRTGVNVDELQRQVDEVERLERELRELRR